MYTDKLRAVDNYGSRKEIFVLVITCLVIAIIHTKTLAPIRHHPNLEVYTHGIRPFTGKIPIPQADPK